MDDEPGTPDWASPDEKHLHGDVWTLRIETRWYYCATSSGDRWPVYTTGPFRSEASALASARQRDGYDTGSGSGSR